MATFTKLSFLALGCTLAACQHQDEFVNNTPDTSGLTMELTGDTTAEGLATASTGDGLGLSQAALSGPVPEYLGHTRDAIRTLNAAILRILEPITAAIAARGSSAQVGDVRLFGPVDRGAATFLFAVKKLSPTSFGWMLKAKPLGAADSAYVQVMGALFTPGALPHRGTGVMGIDLDKLATVDSDFHGAGQMLVGFAHVLDFKVLAYGLKGFSPDVTQWDPVDAVFSGWRNGLGEARARVAVYANIDDSLTAAKELLLLRAHWLPGVGGRADGRVLVGDVPAGRMIVANSCWSRDLTDVDGFLLVRDCPVGLVAANCNVIRTAGALANCAPRLGDEDLPPLDPGDGAPESGAPQDPTIPTTAPTGN